MRRNSAQHDSRRRQAAQVICPTCGALPGFLCIGVRGATRTALHADRIATWRGERPL
ncbi:zinc finger domain-containing protein [Novosphingobium ovatum]